MVGFFEEKEGVKSSMRLMSFLLLMFMFVFDFGYLAGQVQINLALQKAVQLQIDWNFMLMNFIFLIGVFAPKYLQKIAELKLGKDGNNIKTE